VYRTRTVRPVRPTTPARPPLPAVAVPDRRPALVAAVALAALTALSIPATALLDTADRPATRTVLGLGFLVVAALEVVVGWGLYVVLHARAHSSAYAALVSRAGYAVLLTAAAGRLLWPGGDGVAGFRADWSLALVVLGVHLLVTSVALWHSHGVPGAVVSWVGTWFAVFTQRPLAIWQTSPAIVQSAFADGAKKEPGPL